MMETNLNEAVEKVPKSELVYDGNIGTCRCIEFEERSKKAEARCLELESEARKRKSEYEELKTRFRTLEASKLALEDEMKGLKSRNNKEGLIEGAVDLAEDKVFHLMAENKVLECEKSKAENEAMFWKVKFDELETLTSELQKSSVSPDKGTGNVQPAGTPVNDTTYKRFTSDEEDYRMRSSKLVKRPLSFQMERSLSKQMAPSTPAGTIPASDGVIDIHDSDDNPANIEIPSMSKIEDVDGNISSKHELEGTVDSENDTMTIGDTVSFVSVTKRKRASNIVTSDTESDNDDNIPIGKLRGMRRQEVIPATATPGIDNCTPRKRRLVRQSEREVKTCSSRKNTGSKFCKGTPTTEDVEDGDSDEIGSDGESDSDSLSGFIVNESDDIVCDNSCSESEDDSDCYNARNGQEDVSNNSSAHSDSKDVSNNEVNFSEILSQLKRTKECKSCWKFEGEMLAAFGKDPELCMRAVCALYRQQTEDEKLSKGALCHNRRGFSKFDANRGCTLAEFLTDGEPHGDLMKSVEELQAYDSNAIEICRDLATRYSKQLFKIYNNKKDPYFHP